MILEFQLSVADLSTFSECTQSVTNHEELCHNEKVDQSQMHQYLLRNKPLGGTMDS